MPTLNRLWFLAGSLAFAGSVAAQGQPQADPKTVAPVTATPGVDGSTPAPRLPGSSGRNQFANPVMGIDIKGEGLSLPAGVVQPEEPLVPPAKPAPAPAPQPATAK